jgi:hypothetical protein
MVLIFALAPKKKEAQKMSLGEFLVDSCECDPGPAGSLAPPRPLFSNPRPPSIVVGTGTLTHSSFWWILGR